MGKMKEWGLVNVKMEPWVNRNGFERGWTNDKFYMQAVSPRKFAVPGTPTAWTPGTKGLVSGEVVMVTANNDAELGKYKGKLRGKWVITGPAPERSGLLDRPGDTLHQRGADRFGKGDDAGTRTGLWRRASGGARTSRRTCNFRGAARAGGAV